MIDISERFAYYLTEDHSENGLFGEPGRCDQMEVGGWPDDETVERFCTCPGEGDRKTPPNPIKCPDSRNLCKQGLKSRSLVVFCYLLVCFRLGPSASAQTQRVMKSRCHPFPLNPSNLTKSITLGNNLQGSQFSLSGTWSSGLTCFGVWGSFPSLLVTFENENHIISYLNIYWALTKSHRAKLRGCRDG